MILGCSIDKPAANKAFKEKFDFAFDLLSDETTEMSKAYGVPIRDNGMTTRVSVLIGPDGKIVKWFAEVSPADHPDEVLALL